MIRQPTFTYLFYFVWIVVYPDLSLSGSQFIRISVIWISVYLDLYLSEEIIRQDRGGIGMFGLKDGLRI